MRRIPNVVRFGALALVLVTRPAHAQVNWTDWTGSGSGQVQGVISTLSGPVDVTYSGPYSFAQTSGGAHYFNYGVYDVPNRPTTGDLVALTPAGDHTLTFSRPVTDVFLALVSMGGSSCCMEYAFSDVFTIVSQGPGAYGHVSLTRDASGTVLTGHEGHGVIKFSGTHSSISWTSSTWEHWHGFSVGVDEASNASVTPEPVSMALLGTGLAGIGAVRRRRRKVADAA